MSKKTNPPRDGLLKYSLTPIADLKPLPENARKHSKAQIRALANGMDALGHINPVIVGSDKCILAGHGRVEAAKLRGESFVPTLLVDHLSEAHQRLYAMADNRLGELSSWDEKKRAEAFLALSIEAPDLELTLSGFDAPKIELDIARVTQTDWSDLDTVPEDIPQQPITRVGDAWDFGGKHSLVCGDSTDPDVVSEAVHGAHIRLVAQDPPFNRKTKEFSGNGRKKHADFVMGAGEMTKAEYRRFLNASISAVSPHLINGALGFQFIDWAHVSDVLFSLEELNAELKTIIVWDKGKASMGSLYRNAHELIVVSKHGKEPHVNNIQLGRHGRDRQTIWRYPGMNRFGTGRDRALNMHPTVKPVGMICDLFLDVSHRGDAVFDGFSGSGTTLIAAHRMDRLARVIELDPRYCDVAIERFITAFGIEPTHRDSGLSFSAMKQLRLDQMEVRHDQSL